MPTSDQRAFSRYSGYTAFMARSSSGSSGPFHAGMLKFAVRWNTVRCVACFATMGMAWIAVDPVPTTPTRMPVKSTASCGHWPVWYHCPS